MGQWLRFQHVIRRCIYATAKAVPSVAGCHGPLRIVCMTFSYKLECGRKLILYFVSLQNHVRSSSPSTSHQSPSGRTAGSQSPPPHHSRLSAASPSSQGSSRMQAHSRYGAQMVAGAQSPVEQQQHVTGPSSASTSGPQHQGAAQPTRHASGQSRQQVDVPADHSPNGSLDCQHACCLHLCNAVVLMAILPLVPSKGGSDACKLEMLWLLGLHGYMASSCMQGL